MHAGSVRYSRLGNLRYDRRVRTGVLRYPDRSGFDQDYDYDYDYDYDRDAVILSCHDYSMGFWGNCVAVNMNVTGVDWNGPEWTGVDIFSGKNFLTQFGEEKEKAQ